MRALPLTAPLHAAALAALMALGAVGGCANELEVVDAEAATGQSLADDVADEWGDATDDDGPAEDHTDIQALSAGASCDRDARTGDYCAGDKVSGGVRGTLYRCNGPGAARVKQTCSAGCVVAPAGSDDYCRAAPAPSCDRDASTGDYCGGDKVSNANPSTLYRCNGPGRATVVQVCSSGCVVAPAGSDDYCRAAPAPRCDADAFTGEYCGGDKVSHGDHDTLYTCDGPGPARVVERCGEGCTVAPPGVDDFCEASDDECARRALLRWGLAPRASDEFRCAGVAGGSISQTIGNAAASAGYHATDGHIGGAPYCAATDLSTRGLTDSQVRALLSRLADGGFAAFHRQPGRDGWPSSEARHIHAVYVGVPMKSQLRGQVSDWLNGRNGLASHTSYTFWQPSESQKRAIRALYNQHN